MQVAYNQAMASCSWEQAWSCFNVMRRTGVQPNTRSYNAVGAAFQHTHTGFLVPVNTPRLAGMLRALCSSRLKELVCRAHVCGQKEYVDLLGK